MASTQQVCCFNESAVQVKLAIVAIMPYTFPIACKPQLGTAAKAIGHTTEASQLCHLLFGGPAICKSNVNLQWSNK